MSDPVWLKVFENDLRLTLYVQPGAKKTEIAGIHGGALKIRVAAPAVDGKANAALILFLARYFEIKPADILLKSGEKSRHKIVNIKTASPKALAVFIAEKIT